MMVSFAEWPKARIAWAVLAAMCLVNIVFLTTTAGAQELPNQELPNQELPNQEPPSQERPHGPQTESATKTLELPAPFVSPSPGKPVLVLAGLHVHEVTGILLREQTFSALLTLTLQWNDQRLAFDPNEIEGNRKIYDGEEARKVVDTIWTPSVIFYNAVQSGRPEYHVTVYPSGFVNLRALKTVSSRYDAKLRAFPFDVQTLRFMLTAFDTRDDTFELRPLAFTLSESDQSVVPSDYEVGGTTSRFSAVQTSAEGFQRALIYSLEVSRQSRYYITRYMLPLTGLLFLSWTTFLMLDTKLHDRLKVLAITILAFITFMLFLNRDLPRIPYMTALGFYIALCGLIPILAAVQSLAVDRLVNTDRRDLAIRLERVSLWIFPLFYVVLVIAVGIYAVSFR